MKIKRTSWHYKISNLGGYHEKRTDTLCWYFWRLVGKVVLIFSACLILSVLFYTYVTDPEVVFNTLVILFTFASCVLPILVIWYVRKKLGKSPTMPYGEKTSEYGNVLFEYLKAAKEKVCPLIKYE